VGDKTRRLRSFGRSSSDRRRMTTTTKKTKTHPQVRRMGHPQRPKSRFKDRPLRGKRHGRGI